MPAGVEVTPQDEDNAPTISSPRLDQRRRAGTVKKSAKARLMEPIASVSCDEVSTSRDYEVFVDEESRGRIETGVGDNYVEKHIEALAALSEMGYYAAHSRRRCLSRQDWLHVIRDVAARGGAGDQRALLGRVVAQTGFTLPYS